MFTLFKVKDTEYKLRLSAKSCIELEKRIKTNPLNLMLKIADGEMPFLEQLLIVLHCSMTEFQANTSMEDIYHIWDEYCEDGGNFESFIGVIAQLFMDAGFVPKENNSKNV